MKKVALTPPKGWNSWDIYGASVTEEEVRSNARVMADKLKSSGWDYVVVDIQWYEPTALTSTYNTFASVCMDEFSRVIPAVNRFPSSEGGNGFKPLADYIHSLGLKFGIHILRGIPREAVHKRLPVKDTHLTADEIATNTICPWNSDMYGVNTELAEGQLYYDSLLELYASWDIDFIKVDDIAFSKIYPNAHLDEIKAIRKAIDKVDRNIVLSLSPGPAHLRDGAFLQQNANMWRLTDDFWDEWPMILDMFERCNSWSPFIRPGNWPDCDMLPLGRIAIRSDERGLSERDTRLSKDEQQTMMTLWSIFQSPLMFGGDMTQLDEWTLSLLNNEEINAMHLKLINQKQVYRDNTWVIWEAMSPHDSYVAVFNISDTVAVLPEELKNEYLPASDYLELWRGKDKSVLKETVNPHASYIFRALSKN